MPVPMPPPPPPLDRRDALLYGGLALAKLAIHLVSLFLCRYGWFGDEFYYLDCARHLAWGYVDHPPLAMALLAGWTALFGDGLVAVRLPAVLAGTATVTLAGLIARELGGRRFAQGLTGLSALILGVFLATHSYYSMNALDHLLWAAVIYLLVRLVRRDRPRLWLPIGLVAGLGLLNKYSLAFLGVGLAVGLLSTPLRRHIRSRYLWAGAGLAALVALPHLLWQIAGGWPSLEFIHNAMTRKMVGLSFGQFALGQVLEAHPANVPLWLGGLATGLLARGHGLRRLLAVSFLTIFLWLGLSGAKVYYLAPAFLLVLPLGAVRLESLTARARAWRPVAAATMAVTGLAVAPLALPLLPPESFLRYQAALGLAPPVEEHGAQGAFPQHLGWRFGWPEFVAQVAAVHAALPEAERARCAVFSPGYGAAGAVNRLGRDLGLPRAICSQNSHWLWGPGDWDGAVLIAHMSPRDRDFLAGLFGSVELAALTGHPYAPAYERDRALFVCRDLQVDRDEIWRRVKNFN